jgi:hypothetical protein
MYKIICYTLFDITNTGVLNRNRPPEDTDVNLWQIKRNTQSNFDTILQAISLRALPEIVDKPVQTKIKFNEFTEFGFLFEDEIEEQPCWNFTFYIMSTAVFNDGINELGALYDDCHHVPMIKVGTEWNKLSNYLDSSPELKNIHFKVIDHG